jgi:serine/threonine-protein kinase
MRYLHLSEIVHRDLKPSNILVDGDGHSMIGDFGVSLLLSEDATPTSRCGTVAYSAPELCEEGVVATRKSDVFSFGLILYELVVGSPVFPAANGPYAVIRRLRARDLPKIPPKCGSLMQELIPRCWSMDPDHRPSFEDILELFREDAFSILPNADPTAIRSYCAAVEDWERQAGISA